ncbi:YkvA family protein [Angustibacter aerolatus]
MRAVPRLVRAVHSGEYTGTTGTRLIGLALAAGYVLSPIDLVPEVPLGLLGLGDDAFVLSWLAARLLGETDAFLRWERAGEDESGRRRFGRWRRRGERHASEAGRPDVVPGQVVR